jgi:ABC-type branched-subunit amino acid transport system substrate-binding protein
MPQIHRRGVHIALLALLMSSAGCGGDTQHSPTGDASTTTASTPTGAPVKLMVVYESVGPSAVPQVPEGAIAAAKAINAQGGIKGRPVRIIRCDTKADPNVATRCGRRAVAEGVVAMVGDLTIYGNQFMPALAKHKIASIGLEPATATDFTSPASFPIGGGAPVVFAGLGADLAEAGAKNIVLARQDIPAAAGVAPFVNAGLKRFGLKMRDVPVPVGAPDMSPYAAAALKDGTDGIVLTLANQDSVSFVRALRQADPKVKIAMNAPSNTQVNKALGGDADGIIETVSVPTVLKSTAGKRYDQDMKAAGYDDVTGYRLPAYAAVRVVQQLGRDLPRVTAPAIYDALRHATNLPTGVTPPLQFTKGGVAGLPRVFNPCLLAMRVQGNALVPTTGKFENAFTGKACETPA